VQKIVGGFTIKTTYTDTPDKIWEKCKNQSDINEVEYRKYCGKSQVIHAYEIDQVYRLRKPLDPNKLFSCFNPPQSYCYLELSIAKAIIPEFRRP
jgi:type I restriction enzyme S subunit